ncbi:sensor histidine kinase [Paenibacillus favisporus]|uniref:sensor histidine kinase n=1 Tax=Paenibacillus favisporus TaxID=221028 RepID=UPI002DB6B9B8|nr:sensor histidine kinase [Paenibacillus favisporus]MEC0174347.1 sensor histidine kinase [Paenibacillus favisporus]
MQNFTAMARLLSHLGDQLISSSEVALLELIKNSYDAGSKQVDIIINQKKRTMVIKDKGKGMNKADISEKFLVIGTNNRLIEQKSIIEEFNQLEMSNDEPKEKDEISSRVPLGEKGLGRFATMKLANKLLLVSKSKFSSNGALLMVDWNQCRNDSTKTLEEIRVHLFDVCGKELKSKGYFDDINPSFTLIKLYDIRDFYNQDIWDGKKFETFYRDHFMKYVNPFRPNKGFQIRLEIVAANGDFYRFTPETLDKKLLDQAHYKLSGKIIGKELKSSFYIKGADGREFAGDLDTYLSDLEGINLIGEEDFGPIDFEFYFFNRRGDRLKEIKGYTKITDVRKLLDQYSGGIMIYRDNFRVLPYAERGDDWLDMDKEDQFRSEGIRFNTIQTVGAIFITTLFNYNLRDQTNREGLIHNNAFNNLYDALRAVLKSFKAKIDQYYPRGHKNNGPLTTDSVNQALSPFQSKLEHIKNNIDEITKYTATEGNDIKDTIQTLNNDYFEFESSYYQVRSAVNELEKRVTEIEDKQRMVLDLAGIGLMAETVAHELRSYVNRMLGYLSDLQKKIPSQKEMISLLISNTKSIDSVITRLDAQAITRRRTKSKVRIVNLIAEIISSKKEVWKQEGTKEININLQFDSELWLKVNQGMIVQVFDNLLNNSHYWLLRYCKENEEFQPMINIMIYSSGIVEFSDNGRGISPIDSEAVFEPFFSRKKDGRGLGLYIISDIMSFHNSDITLSEGKNSFNNRYKFIVDLSSCLIK